MNEYPNVFYKYNIQQQPGKVFMSAERSDIFKQSGHWKHCTAMS